jgi:hypothetical protein
MILGQFADIRSGETQDESFLPAANSEHIQHRALAAVNSEAGRLATSRTC